MNDPAILNPVEALIRAFGVSVSMFWWGLFELTNILSYA